MRLRLLLAAAFASAFAMSSAQSQGAPPRAVRRDIPLTNMIRRAMAAGTRDSTGRPGRNYWQLSTDYAIKARFDATTGVVSGTEHVIVRNNSDSVMRAVVLRLDQNIFAPNVPRAEALPSLTEGMRVTRLAVDGQTVDLAAPAPRPRNAAGAQPTAPTVSGLTQTVATIRLPKPIAARSSVALDADWSFRVPPVDGERGMRMGAWGDSLFQVAQWYPRVAVFDDLRQGGWDTDPYLGPSEFYNNYGHFDVQLDLPAGWLVGSSGVLQNAADVLTPAARERLSHVLGSDSVRTIVGAAERGAGRSTAAGERLTWHFVADSVADVAWATSNQFVWDATRATIPGGAVIPVYAMYLPGHAAAYAGALPSMQHALQFYSRLWMPYAFPQLTTVDGPEGGMEYPMFIMSGTGAADHETGHQWWPMMVGVNETWYGFMDEGFNQYMNILSAADRRHQPAVLDKIGQSYGRISGDEREAPLMWDANYGGPLYSFQAYGKAPQMLSMLGGIVGDSAVQRAMSDYATAWRFKHPSPWDYAFFMNNALGRDLGWFWNYWLFTTESVDGSILKVTRSGNRTTVTVRQDGQMPSPVVLAVQLAPTGPRVKAMRNAVMTDDHSAIVTYPVDVWFKGNRTFEATLDFGGRKIEKITLDPHGRFPDRALDDNVWPREPAKNTTP